MKNKADKLPTANINPKPGAKDLREELNTIEQIQSRLLPVFQKYHIKKAFLFGSYGKGNAKTVSDIDLLVDSGLSGLRFVGFMEDVRQAVDKEVDLLDVTHIEKIL